MRLRNRSAGGSWRNASSRSVQRHGCCLVAAASAARGTDMATDKFPGLTADLCCEGCHEEQCIISGMTFCLHPYKSGLQATHRMMPAVMQRFDRARKKLRAADAIVKAEREVY